MDDNLVKLLVNWATISDDEAEYVKKCLSDIIKYNINTMFIIRQTTLVYIVYFIDENGDELPTKIVFNNTCYKIYNEQLDDLLNENRGLLLEN